MDNWDRVDFRAVLRVLKRRSWLIVALGLAAGGLAYGLSFLQATRYDASAQLLFRTADYAQTLFGSSSQSGSTDPQRDAATDLALASLPIVTARAKAILHSPLTVDQLSKQVSVTPVGQADIVMITGHARTPGRAAYIANVFADQVVALRREAEQGQVQTAIDSLGASARAGAGSVGGTVTTNVAAELARLKALKALQTGDVEVVQPATPPLHRAAPLPLRNGLIGLGAGLCLATLAMLVLYRLDRRVRDPEHLQELLEVPVLAKFPLDRSIGSRRRDPRHEYLFFEQFQFLRSNLQLQDISQDSRVIAITSALPGDGKTTVAVGLARALASSGARVIAIDCDLRKPMLARSFGLGKHPGLSEVLVGSGDPLTLLQEVQDENVRVLSAGMAAVSPAIALGLRQLPDIVVALAGDADYLILDTPPIQVAAEASAIAAACDGVVWVVDISQDHRDLLQATRRQLVHARARILGVAINRTPQASMGAGYYEYYQPGGPGSGRGGGRRRAGVDGRDNDVAHANHGRPLSPEPSEPGGGRRSG